MVEQYGNFAYIYDRLMEDVDYKSWADYIDQIIKMESNGTKKVLELACGTGNITMHLLDKGYDVIGVDISQDMLMVAKDKAVKKGKNPLLIQQNIVELDIDEVFPCVLCMCDGFNYITEEDDLRESFARIYNSLEDNGVFIFDISSYHKLRNVLGNNTFGENLGDICYLWENYFNEEDHTVEMDLTFFIEENGLYKKEEEYHLQRAYRNEEIINILIEENFKNVRAYDGFNFNSPKENSERVFFIATK